MWILLLRFVLLPLGFAMALTLAGFGTFFVIFVWCQMDHRDSSGCDANGK